VRSPRRTWSWIILAACLTALGFVVNRQLQAPSTRHDIGSGPAGPAVPREPWTKSWSTAPVVLIGLGDSVTAGYGTFPAHSYFSRIAANPEDEVPEMKGICLRSVFPNFKAVNLSVSGTISAEHAEEQFPKIERGGPDTRALVVITTGGNDLIHDYGHNPPREGALYGARLEHARPWIANFEKRIQSLFQRIRDLFPGGCHIFVADIFDPTDGVGDIEHAGLPPWPDGEAILKAYNEAIHRTASSLPFVHVVPMHDAFLGHGIHCAERGGPHYRPEDPHYWYYTNLEDPNDRGYDAIRRLFLLEMAKVLAAGR